jgi:hypothetical protein
MVKAKAYATIDFLYAPPAPHIAVRLCVIVANINDIASKLSFDASQ